MRSLFWACAFLLALVQVTVAAPTVAEIKKAVVEGYAMIDRLSISCWYVSTVAGSGSNMGPIEYCFDRRTKQLAIGSQGTPVVLVKDNQAFFLLWYDKKERPTYLEISKDHAITWNDIVEASQVIWKECGPYGGWRGQPCFAFRLGSIMPCFVVPFLDGGTEKLFSKETKVLYLDPELLATDPHKAAHNLVETGECTQIELSAFRLGHPDSVFIPRDPPKLDPKKFPVCFKTVDGSSSWVYAFDQQARMLSAAVGTVDHTQLGSPGNKITIAVKKIASFGDARVPLANGRGVKDEGLKPVPLQLPKDAKTIEIADLKRSYLEAMSEIGLETILERKAYLEEKLHTTVQEDRKTDRKTGHH